jgi:cytochrome c peroxidase
MRFGFAVGATVGACVILACGCGSSEAPFPSDDELAEIMDLHNVHTPSSDATNLYADSADAAQLGKLEFMDTGFSSCGVIACASCHPPPVYTTTLAFPPGCNGPVTRTPPTLLNTSFNEWFYWDGRKDALWSHPIFPLLNHVELASTPQAVQQHMSDSYTNEYRTAFGVDPAKEPDPNRVVANFGKAMEAYLRSIIKVDAPFDQKLDSFVTAAQAGKAESDPFYLPMKVFIRKGHCIICHKGAMLSDRSFHNLGLMDDPNDQGHKGGIQILLGDMFNGGSKYSDNPAMGQSKIDALSTLTDLDTVGAFKTPSLRNVAVTAPYMHTGGEATLMDVVNFYNRGGDPVGTFAGTRAKTIVKLDLADDEKQALIDLLNSLTGSETP